MPGPYPDWLRRLPPEFYRGEAFVHWTLAIEGRRTGWLTPTFHARLRELLVHALLRAGLVCPIYCAMPDHVHLLWWGLRHLSDQRLAMSWFRRQLNRGLVEAGFSLQKQGHDHVLRDDERLESALVALMEYIARNPERRGLVPADGYASYPFTGSVIPGYPEVDWFEPGAWGRIWSLCSRLRESDFFSKPLRL